jgi:hypothetical protein
MSTLMQAASAAVKPRERCAGKTCSCSDYPRRMAAFHELATPQRILQMLAESQDQSTKLEIALDILEGYAEVSTEPSLMNAIETLRGK